MLMKNLINKVLTNLIRPHYIPFKIYKKINYYLKYKNYKQSIFEQEQNNIFNAYGLNRADGIKKLNIIKNKFDNFFVKNIGMSSEHEIIFSSLSLKKNHSFNEILEIGTYDGFNAFLLSTLFPNSNIDTIDLPDNDKDFVNFYNRKNILSEFVKDRNYILSKNKNINFYSLNSLNLLNNKKKYDLIWIDGAHGYPIVCIDIINSLHMISENGLILCDDVKLNINHVKSDRMYHSIASYETLNELKKQNIIDFRLVYKRLSPKKNCVEKDRKYIAIVNKR